MGKHKQLGTESAGETAAPPAMQAACAPPRGNGVEACHFAQQAREASRAGAVAEVTGFEGWVCVMLTTRSRRR